LLRETTALAVRLLLQSNDVKKEVQQRGEYEREVI